MSHDRNARPVEEPTWLKTQEIIRDFKEIRRLREAHASRQGWLERSRLHLRRLLMKSSRVARDPYHSPSPAHVSPSSEFSV